MRLCRPQEIVFALHTSYAAHYDADFGVVSSKNCLRSTTTVYWETFSMGGCVEEGMLFSILPRVTCEQPPSGSPASQVVIPEGLWILMNPLQSWILHPFLVSVIPSPAPSASVPVPEAQVPRSSAFCCTLLSPVFPPMKRLWVLLGGTPGAPDVRLLQPGSRGVTCMLRAASEGQSCASPGRVTPLLLVVLEPNVPY